VEISRHPLQGVHELGNYERAIAGFAERIDRWNVELVYANTRQTFYAIAAAHRLGLPSIWNQRESEPVHSYFGFLGSEIAGRALDCFAYPYKVVFVADTTRQNCEELNTRNNFTTIHNGLDTKRFAASLRAWPREEARRQLGLLEDQIMVLLPGTVCERKGQMDLVEAVSLIDEGLASRLRCFIVGDRQYEYSDRLKAVCARFPESKQASVRIVPETPEIARYYAAADILICSSRIESFPRVILEAMAAGLPIITTPVFGISEQVKPEVNALIYQPGDARQLAGRLSKLSSNPGYRKELGSNSPQVLDCLTDFEEMASAYARIFREAWLSGGTRACAGSPES
jgi:glycosyltransferase involved in cell wall biosynthesis